MTDTLFYKVQIKIERGADIEKIEERLEDHLLDLYDIETIEGILVKDKTPPIDEDMDELLRVISELDNEQIQGSIEVVREMENLGDLDES